MPRKPSWRVGPTGASARVVTPAGLNFGDCFAYALARSRGEALLYNGQDFAKTDVESILEPSPP